MWMEAAAVIFTYCAPPPLHRQSELFTGLKPTPSPTFDAALLAGGRSTRMGRDKAEVVVGGLPLWQLQLVKLRTLAPCELFISGRLDGPYANASVEIVPDRTPGFGPLAGIAAVLERATTSLVLVLAVDLPAMTPAFLVRLTERATIPRHGDNFEPLAAVYPKAALPIAERILGEEDRSLQRFARELIEKGIVRPLDIGEHELPLFRNVNRPEDLA
jgi:molybdopterin-guanine dinucleotide biosynthesis protein A